MTLMFIIVALTIMWFGNGFGLNNFYRAVYRRRLVTQTPIQATPTTAQEDQLRVANPLSIVNQNDDVAVLLGGSPYYWSNREVSLLNDLVAKHVHQVSSETEKKKKKNLNGWPIVAKELGRSLTACRIKWNNGLTKPSKGKFSIQEDKFIRQRVAELGIKTRGMWGIISKELNRSDVIVRQRWQTLLANKNYTLWTESMDAALLTAVRDNQGSEWTETSQWVAVSVRMQRLGYNQASTSCYQRWHKHLLPFLQGEKEPEWTPQEVDQLLDMHSKGAEWNEIGQTLHCAARVCSLKWHTLQQRPMEVESIDFSQFIRQPTAKSIHNRWNTTMTARLEEAVQMFGTHNWSSVAEHVGYNKTPDSCSSKWSIQLQEKDFCTSKDSHWSDSESTKLRELVTKRLLTTRDTAGAMDTSHKIDWIAISKQLGRSVYQCERQWQIIKFEKKGFYTTEEDVLIQHRIKEQGDKKSVWKSLSKELHRSTRTLKARWNRLHEQKRIYIRWTKDMDTALINIVKATTSPVDWNRVAACLLEQGYDVTVSSCARRYENYLKYQLKSPIAPVVWTPEVINSLKVMREQGMSWEAISTTLNTIPRLCESKWNSKRGPFTEEEDVLIRQKVQEWRLVHGEKNILYSMWSLVVKELNRSARSLYDHWAKIKDR